MTRTVLCGLRGAHLRVCAAWWTMVARFRLWLNGATVGRNLVVTGPLHLRIHRTANISIGDNCKMHSGFAHNPVGGYHRMGIWVGDNGCLAIGSGVGISNSTIVCSCKVVIGDHARIGGGCRIYDTDFHSIRLSERVRVPQTGVVRESVCLGRGCFIGGHSTILKDVEIGEEAVVGAGSVVAKNVPAGEIWAGNPCRFLRNVPTA